MPPNQKRKIILCPPIFMLFHWYVCVERRLCYLIYKKNFNARVHHIKNTHRKSTSILRNYIVGWSIVFLVGSICRAHTSQCYRVVLVVSVTSQWLRHPGRRFPRPRLPGVHVGPRPGLPGWHQPDGHGLYQCQHDHGHPGLVWLHCGAGGQENHPQPLWRPGHCQAEPR